jgi:hypothetical protein
MTLMSGTESTVNLIESGKIYKPNYKQRDKHILGHI